MGELFVIFSFIILAGLIVFGFATKVHQRSVAHEERRLELKARIAEAKAGTGGEPNRKLEERVRVLERLATDRPGITSASLADEIESLRAETPVLTERRERETQQ